jgi:hypothetical protein
MAEKRQYQLRQAILSALADVYPGGKDDDELLRSRALVDRHASLADLDAESAILLSGGYLQNLRLGRGDAWWKITHSGLLQSRKESVLDEVVWGTDAL